MCIKAASPTSAVEYRRNQLGRLETQRWPPNCIQVEYTWKGCCGTKTQSKWFTGITESCPLYSINGQWVNLWNSPGLEVQRCLWASVSGSATNIKGLHYSVPVWLSTLISDWSQSEQVLACSTIVRVRVLNFSTDGICLSHTRAVRDFFTPAPDPSPSWYAWFQPEPSQYCKLV